MRADLHRTCQAQASKRQNIAKIEEVAVLPEGTHLGGSGRWEQKNPSCLIPAFSAHFRTAGLSAATILFPSLEGINYWPDRSQGWQKFN
jgi:hypothetical protein